mgnify:FL=1|jgi:hypothetical protein
MKRIAARSEVMCFLRRVKRVARHPKGFVLIPRKENLDILAEYGFLRSFPREVVQKLSIRNYSYTDHDVDRPGEVWVFGKEIEGVSFYIKIKLDSIDGRHLVKCLSFHPENPDKPSLEFPYRR